MHLPTLVMTTNKLLSLNHNRGNKYIYENDTIRGYMTIPFKYMRWLVFFLQTQGDFGGDQFNNIFFDWLFGLVYINFN